MISKSGLKNVTIVTQLAIYIRIISSDENDPSKPLVSNDRVNKSMLYRVVSPPIGRNGILLLVGGRATMGR